MIRILTLFIICISPIIYVFLLRPPIPQSLTQKQSLSMIIKQQNSANFVIIDVRSPAEFHSGFINGAVNIDWNTNRDELLTLKSTDTLLLYCQSGRRSKLAQQYLIDHGYESVYNIEGGINALRNETTAGAFDSN